MAKGAGSPSKAASAPLTRAGEAAGTVERLLLTTSGGPFRGFTREQLDTSYRHLSATAHDMRRAWQSGEFPPHPSAWNCSRCEYRTVCDEGRSLEEG